MTEPLWKEAGMMETPRAALLVQEAPSDLAAVVARLVKSAKDRKSVV